MNLALSTSTSNGAVHTTLPSARADGTMADHSRSLNGEAFVMRTDAHRDDADMAGHRFTEVYAGDEAA